MSNYPGLFAVQKLTSACPYATGLEDVFTRATLLNRNQNKPQEVNSQADNMLSHTHHSPCFPVETLRSPALVRKQKLHLSLLPKEVRQRKGPSERGNSRQTQSKSRKSRQPPAWHHAGEMERGCPRFSVMWGRSRGTQHSPNAYCQVTFPLHLSNALMCSLQPPGKSSLVS